MGSRLASPEGGEEDLKEQVEIEKREEEGVAKASNHEMISERDVSGGK